MFLLVTPCIFFINVTTVSSVLEAAASNYFDVIFDQILLNRKCVLLRLLFEGGFYLRAASNTEFTVYVSKDNTELHNSSTKKL